jgi:hypothetical protein
MPEQQPDKPRSISRFSFKRLLHPLSRPVSDIQTAKTPDEVYEHSLTVDNTDGTAAKVIWREDDKDTMIVRARLVGIRRMRQGADHTHFETEQGEQGMSVDLYESGINLTMVPTAETLRREALRREQERLDWWDRSPEIMENAYVTETGFVVASPDGEKPTQKGTPYRHFKLAIPLSEEEMKTFDVYAYQQGIGLVDRRKLQAQDRVRLRASVHYHDQHQSGGKTIRVPWLRLFDVQRIR